MSEHHHPAQNIQESAYFADTINIQQKLKRPERTGINCFVESLSLWERLESGYRHIECVVNSPGGSQTFHLPPGEWAFIALAPDVDYHITFRMPSALPVFPPMAVSSMHLNLDEAEIRRFRYKAHIREWDAGTLTELA